MSLRFDALVEAFEAGRGLPLAAQEGLIGLVDELAEGRRLRILDAGAGTGRLALPLLVRGHDVVALDRVRSMLDWMAAKLAEVGPLPGACRLVLGDVTALPFADGTFEAAILSNVLYQVADWRRALDEISRVLHPDGALLLGVERSVLTPALTTFDRQWRAEIEATGYRHPPQEPDDDTVLAEVDDRAASCEVRQLATWETGRTVAEALDGYGERLRPLYPTVPDDAWRETVSRFTDWARAAFPDLSTRLDCTVTLEVTVTRGLSRSRESGGGRRE